MKVSLVSDLHLEFGHFSPELPGGDLLLMAGDIFTAHPLRQYRQDADSIKARKRYQKFCESQLSKYDRVLYVMGNHEPYRENFDDTKDLITMFLRQHAPNTRLLDNETDIIKVGNDEIAVIGSSLWAPCCFGTPDEFRIVNAMNDFNLIRVMDGGNQRRFRPSDAMLLHTAAKEFLAEEVPKHKRVLVMTHHAPSYESAAGAHHGTPWMNPAYCSDMVDFILANPQIEVWGHGHTHYDVDYRVGSTRIIANHRGYFPDERMSRHFNPSAKDFVIEEASHAENARGDDA